MNCDENNGNGMFVTEGHQWAYTVHLKKEHDKRINELNVDNKEVLTFLLEKEFNPRLYETIKMHSVDYGDYLRVCVSGFSKERNNIPNGFTIKEKIYNYVENVLDLLELNVGFENPELLEEE